MTELITGNPLWSAINAVPQHYPWLSKDESCDIAIVGSGLTGAMCAMRFAEAGVDTVLLGASAVGYGSTSAASGIMEYDTCCGLKGLSCKIGMDRAVLSYKMCEQSLNEVEELSRRLGDFGFTRRDGINYTDCADETAAINQEYLLRRHNGFNVELIEKDVAREKYSFSMEMGLLSRGLSGEADPYRLCHELVKSAAAAGARVYEHSRIDRIVPENDGHRLHSTTRYSVFAKKVIIASGYEAAQHLAAGMMKTKTSFAVATAPVDDFNGWPDRAIIHQDDDQSLWVRTTSDNRIIIGGAESALVDGNGKIAGLIPVPRLANKIYSTLENTLKEMFPGVRSIQPQYRFAGVFGETHDRMPVIGEHTDYPGWWFALCPGDNGILWSELAGRALLSLHQNSPMQGIELFSPMRKQGAEMIKDPACG